MNSKSFSSLRAPRSRRLTRVLLFRIRCGPEASAFSVAPKVSRHPADRWEDAISDAAGYL